MPRVRAVLTAATLAAFLPLQACSPSNTPPKVGTTTQAATSAAPETSAAPVASQHATEPLDADYPDPSKLLVDDYGSDEDVATNRPAKPGKSGLAVTVHESGPDEPWGVSIVNEGDAPAELIADTRLLWFEVKVPGQKKSTACKLPDQLGPTAPEPRLLVVLKPGEGVTDSFDPRLYCFAEGDQKLLVPGAQVTPHFGWPEAPPKKRWKAGKLVEEPVLQHAPFVGQRKIAKPTTAPTDVEPNPQPAEPAPAKGTASQKSPGKRGKTAEKTTATLVAEAIAARSDKELIGNGFALRSEYAAWSRRTDPSQASEPTEEGPRLGLRLVQGSDARAEHNATVQMTLENRRATATHVYFRREMVSFDVTGPKGVRLCAAIPDERSPEPRAFVKLEGHGKRTYAARLAELCPLGTFATPGLYLVYGRFDATHAGEEQGLHAFVGPVLSETPAAVRIRVGEAPLLHKRMMPLPTQENAAAPKSPEPAPTKVPVQP